MVGAPHFYKTLSVSVSKVNPHVTVVSLNRAKKRNAINACMWREIEVFFRNVGYGGIACRCILLVGAGKSFCAGIDTADESLNLTAAAMNGTGCGGNEESQSASDVARRALSFSPKISSMQRAFSAMEECSVPVVAAIHGFCIGAGVDLICSADIRICSPSATFSVREVRLGLAADVGTLQRLPKVVGFGSRVRELCLTGEDFGSHEAARIGLVSRVSASEVTLLTEANAICSRIAENSPVAVAGTKKSLVYSRDHSVADGLDHIATHNASALMTNDILQSFIAGASGGKADYAPLLPISRL